MNKYVVSLVLLAMMLKYSIFKIHIPVEYLIEKQFDTKRNYLEQKIRVENWILHEHLYQAENAPPLLGRWPYIGPPKCLVTLHSGFRCT